MRNHSGSSTDAIATIFRDAVDLASDANGLSHYGPTGDSDGVLSGVFLDSPGDTSAHTYTVKIRNTDNATALNYPVSGTAVIILQEVI